ncbi:hypothetical protein N7468_008915 [Penicillium chermesinum]|uniref:BTB domain-containing protein n=1 Tax=Penicillium chermesinum TaxID=63820 RepID=A0A9W9TEI5_9EURO|nr:uncharacterized protein N7468_008915 [Penicillium chermesinum]KAJ5219711.1 hypothetical protein N7468_008915 [Penicillium chermesinum]KAJ6153710.1 hypothetical protein N7470_006669 [Penicillium chermesinum]
MGPFSHTIDPDGDLIIILRSANSPFALAVGEKGPSIPDKAANNEGVTDKNDIDEANAEEQAMRRDEIRFIVSGKHMIFASRFFKKALTGVWKEGVAFLQKDSVEIMAEGWDPEALLIVIRAIHCQFTQIPRKVTLEMLAKIAVIADYYDCRDVLYLMKDIWIGSLNEKLTTPYPRELILWVWVSWFFQLPAHFTESTLAAILRTIGPINGRGLPIPDRVIRSINKTREEAIKNVLQLLHKTREAFLNEDKGCGYECRSIMNGALAMQIRSSPHLSTMPKAPFRWLSYEILKENVLSFKSPRWFELQISRGAGSYRHGCPDSCFDSLFAVLNDPIKGLNIGEFGIT